MKRLLLIPVTLLACTPSAIEEAKNAVQTMDEVCASAARVTPELLERLPPEVAKEIVRVKALCSGATLVKERGSDVCELVE